MDTQAKWCDDDDEKLVAIESETRGREVKLWEKSGRTRNPDAVMAMTNADNGTSFTQGLVSDLKMTIREMSFKVQAQVLHHLIRVALQGVLVHQRLSATPRSDSIYLSPFPFAFSSVPHEPLGGTFDVCPGH